MINLPDALAEELKSECGHTIEDILARKSEEDYRQIRALVTRDAAPDPVLLNNAINLLGRWGNDEVAPDLVALLPRLDERTKINAIDALGRLGGDEAQKAVLDLAHDDSPDVRRFAVSALGRMGTDEARRRLAEMARSDPAGFVRSKARRLLTGPRTQ